MSPYYQFDLDSTAYAVACPTCRADADCPCSERTYRSGFPEPYSVEPHPERVAAGKRWAAEQREHIAQSIAAKQGCTVEQARARGMLLGRSLSGNWAPGERERLMREAGWAS